MLETTDFIDYAEYSYLINTANINETVEYKEPSIFYSEYERYTLNDEVHKEIDEILIKTFDFSWRSEYNLKYGQIGRELILSEEDLTKLILENYGIVEHLYKYFPSTFPSNIFITGSEKLTDVGYVRVLLR